MTYKFKNTFIKDSYTIGGIYESNGPIAKQFDKVYNKDFYYNEKSFEKAETKLLKDNINYLLKKSSLRENDIDLIISGDLQNQISASNYAIKDYNIPYLGIFSACATIGEGIIIASNFIETKQIKNAIVSTVSHNTSQEKQFRNPVEYGTPKPDYSTFTSTGSASAIITNEKTKIKIETATIGKIIDLGQTDVNNMGAIMAPAAADTIYNHLKDLNRKPDYYDLILTGDLGKYGKEILKKYLKKEYNIELKNNYNDCGTILYDIEKQPVLSGGSGPVCSALVLFSSILNQMKEQKIKKVLFVPTGAIFSPTRVFQKQTIPSIAHAVSLEVVEWHTYMLFCSVVLFAWLDN